jgi:hypothetical protein
VYIVEARAGDPRPAVGGFDGDDGTVDQTATGLELLVSVHQNLVFDAQRRRSLESHNDLVVIDFASPCNQLVQSDPSQQCRKHPFQMSRNP